MRERALEECRNQGGYFLTDDEIRKLGELVIRPGTSAPNPKIVGKHATVLAEMAGIKVPLNTRVLIAKLEGVGREYPLSAEKLSPILAFYSAANLAGGIDICQRLLRFGGAGHTASIHSQNEAAIREYGQKVPASRVVVNTSAVHGSIGYSTNLLPAMTLGCGAAGGNITSDNIGPMHLMNIKRIAWESRPVEHRTVPAEQRLSGGTSVDSTQRTAAVAASGGSESPAAETVRAAVAAAVSEARRAEAVPDRRTIARIVRDVLVARGISRGGTAHENRFAAKPSPAEVAAQIVAERVGPARSEYAAATAAGSRYETKPAISTTRPELTPEVKPEAPKIKVAEFVSEYEVRTALARKEKIFIGPKTIVTPSARELGDTHEILVQTS